MSDKKTEKQPTVTVPISAEKLLARKTALEEKLKSITTKSDSPDKVIIRSHAGIKKVIDVEVNATKYGGVKRGEFIFVTKQASEEHTTGTDTNKLALCVGIANNNHSYGKKHYVAWFLVEDDRGISFWDHEKFPEESFVQAGFIIC